MKLLRNLVPEFYHDSKKKIVICKVRYDDYPPYLDNLLGEEKLRLPLFDYVDVFGFGMAKCSDEDEYDEVIGEKISFARAKIDLIGKGKIAIDKNINLFYRAIETLKRGKEGLNELQSKNREIVKILNNNNK